MKLRLAAICLTLVVTVAACGERQRVKTQIDHPRGADELLVRIELRGGFVPERYLYTSVPFFSLFGDGRVITVGPQMEIYPGPALPPLLVTRITEKGIQAPLNEARDAGLMDGDKRYDNPRVADAGTTVFTVVAEGRRNVVEAYALDLDDQDGPRQKLVRFQERIGNLRELIGAAEIIEEEAGYRVERVQVVTMPAGPPESSDIEPQRLPWPLTAPLSTFGNPLRLMSSLQARCAENKDPSLLDALRNATEITIWQSEGKDYTIWARPLLGDETACAPASSTPA